MKSIHAVQHQLRLANSLRRIHMKAAVGVLFQNRSNLPDGLDGSQFAVHRADGNQHRIFSQKLPQLLQIDRAVPPDIHQIHLAALLLKGGQRAAYRGVLQRCGNDVPADMPGHLHNALEGKIIGLAGAPPFPNRVPL